MLKKVLGQLVDFMKKATEMEERSEQKAHMQYLTGLLKEMLNYVVDNNVRL